LSDKIERIVKGGALFLVSNTVTKGLGFIFIVLSSRYLGPVEFGIFTLGLSVSGVAANLGAFGLPATIQRFLSGKVKGKRSQNIYGGILILYVFLSTILALSLFIFSSYISIKIFSEPRLTLVLRVFAVGLIVNIGFNIFKSILQSQEKVKQILIGTSVQGVSKVTFLLVAFIWLQDAFAAALVSQLAWLVALIYLVNKVSNTSLRPSLPTISDIKTVSQYTVPLVFVGFSYFLAQQTDRIMLGWLSTSSDVGIYTVSSALAFVMIILHSSLVSIFMPLASDAYRNNDMDELNKAYRFISKWVGNVNGILSLLFTGAGMILLNIFGTEYATEATYQILVILSFLYFVGTLVGPTGALLQMTDGHKIEMYNTAIYLVLNIVFNYIFILNYGLIGAAWGTLISGLVWNILQVLEIRYYYKLKVVNKGNLKLLIVVTAGMVLCLVYDAYSLYLSALFIGFVILLVFKNVSEEEKQIIMKRIRKYV